MKKLSLKQQQFCQEYINNAGNATEAVIKAGYDVKMNNGSPDRNIAKSIASNNLTKVDILSHIESLLENAGLKDDFVASQHFQLVKQNEDLSIKTRAIDMFYKLRGAYKQSNEEKNSYSDELEAVVNRIRHLLPE